VASKDIGTQADKPDIVLLVLDALRYDHLSCYGYERETSQTWTDSLTKVLFSNGRTPTGPGRTTRCPRFSHRCTRPSNDGAFRRDLCAVTGVQDDACRALEIERLPHGLCGDEPFRSRRFNMTQGFDITEQFGVGKYGLALYWLPHRLGLLKFPRMRLTNPMPQK